MENVEDADESEVTNPLLRKITQVIAMRRKFKNQDGKSHRENPLEVALDDEVPAAQAALLKIVNLVSNFSLLDAIKE